MEKKEGKGTIQGQLEKSGNERDINMLSWEGEV